MNESADPDRIRAWRWRVAAEAANAELHLRYEPGNWGDVLKGTWAVRVARALPASAAAVRYLDPYAGAPTYPLVPASRARLNRLAEIPEQPFASAQSGFAGRDRLGSTAALLLEVWHAQGLRVDAHVFDAEAAHRQAWGGMDGLSVLNVPSGEAALELERHAASPADLILVDPYDCFDHWGAWLPALKRAARRSTVLVYLYNKAPRGTGYADQYRRLRGALERWSADGPLLLGRLAADAVEPRAYHEVLLAGPGARDAVLAGALRSDSEALARLLGHADAFKALSG
ncbi:MAG: hypothetical protein HS116_04915 [Planctomycetes bacterium]|nr:hypothetical protein [Planctomycetota bacterium]